MCIFPSNNVWYMRKISVGFQITFVLHQAYCWTQRHPIVVTHRFLVIIHCTIDDARYDISCRNYLKVDQTRISVACQRGSVVITIDFENLNRTVHPVILHRHLLRWWYKFQRVYRFTVTIGEKTIIIEVSYLSQHASVFLFFDEWENLRDEALICAHRTKIENRNTTRCTSNRGKRFA